MANIKSIGGNPIVLDASGIASGAVTPDKLADMGGITAGAADALTGGGSGTAASWLERTSSADGVVTIRSIHGNTIVQDGALVPVNMTGIESTGFNQWDGEVEQGLIYGATGLPSPSGYAEYRRSKNFVPVFPNTEYYFNTAGTTIFVVYYDADKNPLRRNESTFQYQAQNEVGRTPANARYMRFNGQANQSIDDICINLSDPARNGTYEPYWSSERAIPATDLRSAGSVYDEQTETERITRVGAVDLGTLDWNYNANWGGYPAFWSPSLRALAAPNAFGSGIPSVECAAIEVVSRDTLYDSSSNGITLYGTAQPDISARYSGASDAAAFKAAMSGVMLHYALATPTTTPIDLTINLTYRTEQGGTERVMVPTGELSAPPTIVAAQGYTAESLRDAALSAIAPVENGTASTNYAVGSYLVHGGQLCKVTTAIATGESITIGTNVTATTVMAEVIALIAQ